jgi:hypothetical protein
MNRCSLRRCRTYRWQDYRPSRQGNLPPGCSRIHSSPGHRIGCRCSPHPGCNARPHRKDRQPRLLDIPRQHKLHRRHTLRWTRTASSSPAGTSTTASHKSGSPGIARHSYKHPHVQSILHLHQRRHPKTHHRSVPSQLGLLRSRMRPSAKLRTTNWNIDPYSQSPSVHGAMGNQVCTGTAQIRKPTLRTRDEASRFRSHLSTPVRGAGFARGFFRGRRVALWPLKRNLCMRWITFAVHCARDGA